MTFNRYKCWDTERVDKVIVKKALDVDDATFLATHMPMENIVYEKSPLEIPHTSEENFLNELERMNQRGQHVFAVIKGIPGAGKSHLIRWLAIRYEQLYPSDHVLLIERDNSSLKRTIEQILDKGIYDNDILNEQSRKLENAAQSLTEDGLADTLLGHLQVATGEVEWTKRKKNRRLAPDMISAFLLDQTVRDHLKRKDGPIERIVRFLKTGRELSTDEMPEFEPDDLIFEPKQRSAIRQEGYRNVHEVVDAISRTSDNDREQLSKYLNFLLKNYAISRTINLAAADLREIFEKLREALKLEGKNLVLFIEDIAAFTGIDAGLIDVLINEHTTKGNEALCRLTSVVGLTDHYYYDSLNDHIYDRITHQLTLSSSISNSSSDMLNDEDSIVEFASRYLNVLRLSDTDLNEWYENNAPADKSPNKCVTCEFRPKCHKAFGSVNISSSSSDENNVGLYPFNRTSLTRMYRNLKENIKPTPRTLLDRILSYILQSHSDKIERGLFPPPTSSLAPSLLSQEFNPPAHGRLVEDRGGEDADRLKTLFLFWGDRNVNMTGEDVGGLLPEVFEAFDLKMIAGYQGSEDKDQGSEDKDQDFVENEEVSASKVDTPKLDVKTQSDYSKDISRWYDGRGLGSTAKNEIVKLIADLFVTAIDWESYDISINNYIKTTQASSYFAIEGQSTNITNKHLVFKRTSNFRFALQAIADLNDSKVDLNVEHYGEYMTAIANWLQEVEPEVVSFIRTLSPDLTVQPNEFETILVQNAIMLSCLLGNIQNSSSSDALYQQMLSSTQMSEDKLQQKFVDLSNDSISEYPKGWRELIRKLQRSRSGSIALRILPSYFNATQGDSKEVHFLHATKILKIVFEFEDADWSLNDLPDDLPTNRHDWDGAKQVYKELQKSFREVIENAYTELVETVEGLEILFGDHEGKKIFSDIHWLLERLQNLYPIDSNYLYALQKLDANKLAKLREYARQIKQVSSLSEKAKLLSQGYLKVVVPLKQYYNFFTQYKEEMQSVQYKLKNNDIMSTEASSTEQLVEETKSLYQETIDRLAALISNGETNAS